MKNVEIKVNVINEMKKLRTVTYGDRLAWIEELIQNAQRAGARRVDIKIKMDKVVFNDNGKGCSDPQVLFEKSTSGWGKEVSNQNPFGEGFFSTLMVANKVKVRSIGFEAVFDIRKMFEENTLDCITTKGSSRRSGFYIELTDLEEEYNSWLAEERVKEVAQYISGINFYLNGEKLKHKKFTDTDGSPFAVVINNEYAKGWLRPFNWGPDGYGGDKYKVYAQERFVKDIYTTGVAGTVLIKDGMVDLRSPDRKEIIVNEKAQNFTESMNTEIKRMFIKVLQKGGDKDIDSYADWIDRPVPVEEYEHLIKFVYTTDFADFDKILDGIKEKVAAGEDVNFNEIAEQVEIQRQEVRDEVELKNKPRPLETVEKEATQIVRTGTELRDSKITFYVKKEEMDMFVEKLSLAEYHGLPVVIIRNKLEEKVIEKKENILHIKDLRENVELSAQLKRVGAVDEAEERAMWLFEIISKGLGLDKNIFRIGDMTVYKETKIGDKETVREEEPALAVAYGSEIYIDRKSLKKNKLEVGSKGITNSDRAFIALNMETIAHELAHVLYGTIDNTKEHAEAQITITNKILAGLF